jgi:ketosteroid isomerase-like protein
MTMTRRQVAVAGALALGATSLALGPASWAQSGEEAAVSQAIEALRQAMLAADKAKLEALTSDQLSYGHSSGRVESKTEYIAVIVEKKTIYKSINLLEPSVKVAGSNAIARHIFTAEVESNGKPSTPKIGVLQVWTKENGTWKLLARQAFTLPAA